MPFYFLLQKQFLVHSIKAGHKSTYFLRANSLFLVGFDVGDRYFFCRFHSPETNPSKVPTNYTASSWSPIQN